MPLQNRVTPFSEIVAVAERGALMGNRGVLHDDGRRIVRFSQGRRWIACLTDFRGRRRAPMTPGRLHEDRLEARGRMRRWSAAVDALPDGAMIAVGAAAFLVRDGRIEAWSPAGYAAPRDPPAGPVSGLTPRAIVRTIAAGYRPAIAT